jgi:hypothetical protein
MSEKKVQLQLVTVGEMHPVGIEYSFDQTGVRIRVEDLFTTAARYKKP